MDYEQIDSLMSMSVALANLALQCEKDDRFNSKVADLDIFQVDLLEAFNAVLGLLDSMLSSPGCVCEEPEITIGLESY